MQYAEETYRGRWRLMSRANRRCARPSICTLYPAHPAADPLYGGGGIQMALLALFLILCLGHLGADLLQRARPSVRPQAGRAGDDPVYKPLQKLSHPPWRRKVIIDNLTLTLPTGKALALLGQRGLANPP